MTHTAVFARETFKVGLKHIRTFLGVCLQKSNAAVAELYQWIAIGNILIIFGMTRLGIEPTTCHSQGKHSGLQAAELVRSSLEPIQVNNFGLDSDVAINSVVNGAFLSLGGGSGGVEGWWSRQKVKVIGPDVGNLPKRAGPVGFGHVYP